MKGITSLFDILLIIVQDVNQSACHIKYTDTHQQGFGINTSKSTVNHCFSSDLQVCLYIYGRFQTKNLVNFSQLF